MNFHVVSDPDPVFTLIADPGLHPAFHFDADLDQATKIMWILIHNTL
jgi:hypothetical protein